MSANTHTERPLDLDLIFTIEWDVQTDMAAVGQQLKAGWAATMQDGTKRRRLCYYRIFFGSTRSIVVEDESAVQLGDSLNVNSLNPTGVVYARVTRDDKGEFRYYARILTTDPWKLLWVETLAQPGLKLTEFFAQQIGSATPAWSITIRHDWLRRVVGVPILGSTLDISHAHGLVIDDRLRAIIDLLKPSGLRIVLKE